MESPNKQWKKHNQDSYNTDYNMVKSLWTSDHYTHMFFFPKLLPQHLKHTIV